MPGLVVHTGGIGDFILCCPSIEALARDGEIELLGNTERLDLAVAGGLAKASHALDSVGFQTLFSEPSETLRRFLSRFDRVVVWMKDDDGRIRKGIEECGVTEVEVFPGLPPHDWFRHASEYYLNCLGLEAAPPVRLAISPSEVPRDVVIHPGSGSTEKNWPVQNFLHVASRLETQGRIVTWCTGPAELESETFQLWAGALQGERLCGESLVELAGALASAKVFIGNDAGITHLAAAVGCPTVAVFASTEPQIWAPKGAHVRIAHRGNWPDAESVLAEVKAAESGRT